jgi:hypothetical protein
VAAKISSAAFWIAVVAVAMVAIFHPSGKHLFLFVFDQFDRDQFSFMCRSNCSGDCQVRYMRADDVGVPEPQTKLQRVVHEQRIPYGRLVRSADRVLLLGNTTTSEEQQSHNRITALRVAYVIVLYWSL